MKRGSAIFHEADPGLATVCFVSKADTQLMSAMGGKRTLALALADVRPTGVRRWTVRPIFKFNNSIVQDLTYGQGEGGVAPSCKDRLNPRFGKDDWADIESETIKQLRLRELARDRQ